MIQLRKQINTLLKSYHSQVYYQTAPSTAIFPYIIYDFPNSFTAGEQEIFNFDVDVWDNNVDTTEIETLASNLWRGLNYYRYSDEDIQFSIYRENRLPELDEKEIGLRRRKLIFQLRYFDKKLLD
ncbi:hypothetical protein [Halalkalibacter flavus]|uniref:hypothetical protein n=1 Tax=Halalkalibacter flavus TaxID=3090668 RepID=UPI002FCBC68B